MKVVTFDSGIAIQGRFPDLEVIDVLKKECGSFPLIVADPPYGNVLNETWDLFTGTDDSFANWMIYWTKVCEQLSEPRSALYVWGGIGNPNFRPFYKYIVRAETETHYKLANHITWSKKRAYGIQHNYLFTREELAYFHLGENIKEPRCFNVPLLDSKRGYAGYNEKYPAKSEYFRRTNVWTDIDGGECPLPSDVWTDITEILRNKVHQAQKPVAVMKIPIEIHTTPGEWVLDPFAGSGTTAHAAFSCGRKFAVVEQNENNFDKLVAELSKGIRER